MITNTAQMLEAMTDRAAFETLALRILRGHAPYAAVIRAGTNAKGETIVSKVDGFGQVPGSSPPHFIMFESTTTDAAGLERKWLFDHLTPPSGRPGRKRETPPREADDGDLIKAAREATKLLADHPLASFTIVLATNQAVKRELHDKVALAAARLGVNFDIWEQSRIADALDSTSTGQYLRWVYFRNAAERLSPELLREAGAQSLVAYASYARVGGPDRWVQRDDESTVTAALAESETSLLFLVGGSGFGKTVIAYRVMKAWLRRGGHALWLTEAMVEGAVSIEQAIDVRLRDRFPSLVDPSVRVLSEVLGDDRLLIVIDDVHRATRPYDLLRKIIAWTSAARGETTARPFVFLCPAWPHAVGAAMDTSLRDVRQVSVRTMTMKEACAALGSDTNQSKRIAEQLAFDPFAIALFNELRVPGSNDNLPETVTTHDVLTQFVEKSITRVESLGSSQCTAGEYWEVVETIAQQSLSTRALNAKLSDAREWLGTDRRRSAFGELLKSSAVFWEERQQSKIEYRHDRVRDRLFAYGMKRLAISQNYHLLLDPFFAEVAAIALVDLDAAKELVELFATHLPLVLAIALSMVRQNSDAERRLEAGLRAWAIATNSSQSRIRVHFRYQTKDPSVSSVHVAGQFNNWAETVGNGGYALRRTEGTCEWAGAFLIRPGRHPFKLVINESRWIEYPRLRTREPDGCGGFNSVITLDTPAPSIATAFYDVHSRFVLQVLARTDSGVISRLSDVLPEGDLDADLGRFRNGDARAGIHFFASFLGDPTSSYAARAEAVEAVRRYHLDVLLDGVAAEMPELQEDEQRGGAILLCGFLRTSRSLGIAMDLWRGAVDQESLLAAALWSQLCAVDAPDLSAIDELLKRYLAIPDAHDDDGKRSDRRDVHEYLRLGRPAMSDQTLQAIKERALREPELLSLIWSLCKGVDNPIAVEVMTRLAAALDESSAGQEGKPWGLSVFTDEWTRPGRRMSPESTACLRDLWKHPSESDSVKKYAFQLWITGNGWSLNDVAAIPVDHPFAEDAIWARARHSDRSCSILVAERLAKSSRWSYFASRVWSDDLRKGVERQLEQLLEPNSNEGHDLASLLMRIPREDARSMLDKYWDRLSGDPQFLQTALVVGGASIERRVAGALRNWPTPRVSPFHHLRVHLHLRFTDETEMVDDAAITRLLEYVAWLEPRDIEVIAESCRRRGISAIARARLAPSISEELRQKLFPTEEQLLCELDAIVAKSDDPKPIRQGEIWVRRATEASDGTVDLVAAVDRWLEQSASDARLRLAADALVEIGQRRGIEVLRRRVDSSIGWQRKLLERVTVLIQRFSLE